MVDKVKALAEARDLMVILAGLFANKIALMYYLNMLARSIPLMVVTCIIVGNSSELMLSLQKNKSS